MRITKLTLRDFRRYRELEIPLSPGLTIVHGPNEAGKTTIQRAIELALTRKVTSGGADMDALRSWDAGEDARPVISLEFEIDDDVRGLRTGTLEKAFRGAKGTVRLDIDDTTITDPTLADQALAELTGIPSEAFFRSTASVRHQELADLDRDEAALRDRLQASISGADRGTSRARRKLEKALYDLNTKGAKNPGRLKVAEEAVEQANLAVEQGELLLTQLERDRDTLAGARERRAETDEMLAERRSLLEKARQAERLTAERVAGQERFERYRQAVTVSEELTGLHQSHPSSNPLRVLEQVVGRLRSLDSRIRELKAALSGEVEVSFEVPPEPTWRPISRLAVGLVVVGLLVAAVSVGAKVVGVLDLGSAPQLLGGACAGVGFILAFVARWLRRSDRLQSELRDVEIDRRLRGRSDMELDLRNAEADTAQQLLGLELEDLPAADDLLAREQEHVARIDRLAAQLEGLVGRDPVDSLAGLRDGSALEVEQKTH
ncbi:MAG: AAA family ATPase, partial [Candidatus Limnocylindrales bacterium]